LIWIDGELYQTGFEDLYGLFLLIMKLEGNGRFSFEKGLICYF